MFEELPPPNVISSSTDKNAEMSSVFSFKYFTPSQDKPSTLSVAAPVDINTSPASPAFPVEPTYNLLYIRVECIRAVICAVGAALFNAPRFNSLLFLTLIGATPKLSLPFHIAN